MSKVVETEVRDAGILQRGPKGSADPLKRSALVGEDMVIGQTANLGQSLEGDPNMWRHGNSSARICLGVLTSKGDESPLEVNAVPGQRHNLAEPLSKLVGRQEHGTKVWLRGLM